MIAIGIAIVFPLTQGWLFPTLARAKNLFAIGFGTGGADEYEARKEVL